MLAYSRNIKNKINKNILVMIYEWKQIFRYNVRRVIISAMLIAFTIHFATQRKFQFVCCAGRISFIRYNYVNSSFKWCEIFPIVQSIRGRDMQFINPYSRQYVEHLNFFIRACSLIFEVRCWFVHICFIIKLDTN